MHRLILIRRRPARLLLLGLIGCWGALTAQAEQPRVDPPLHHEAALAAIPATPEEIQALSWILATHDDGRIRDGQTALRLAQSLCRHSQHQSAEHLALLAAAQAELGQWAEAADTLRAAQQLPHRTGTLSLAAPLQQQLDLVNRRLPYRLHHPADVAAPQALLTSAAGRAAAGHVLVGLSFAAQSRHELAIRSLRRALHLAADCAAIHAMLGRASLRAGQRQQAVVHLEQAVRLDPQDWQSYVVLAALAKEDGQPQAALKFLEAALAIRPDAWTVANDLAWLLATSDDPQVRDPDRGLQMAEQLCAQRDQPSATLLDTLAAALAAAGRFDEAVAAVDRALAQPSSAAGQVLLEARRSLYRQGIAYRDVGQMFAALVEEHLRRGEISAAWQRLQQGLEHAPQDRRLWLAEGRLQMLRGDWSAASAAYTRAMHLHGGPLEARLDLAWIQATAEDPQLRQPEAAVNLAADVCHATDWRQFRPLLVLAAAHAAAGRFEQASDMIRRAEGLDGIEPAQELELRRHALLYARRCLPLRDGSGYVQAAEAYAGRGDWPSAQILWLAAAELRPSDPQPWLKLAVLAKARGDDRTAQACYRRVLQQRPDWWQVQNDLAWLHATSRDPQVRHPQEAIRWAQQASGAAGHHRPVVLDTLAAAHAAAGNRHAALAVLDEAVASLEADSPHRARLVAYRRRLAAGQSADGGGLLPQALDLLRQQRLDEGCALLRQYAQRAPDDPEGYLWLAVAELARDNIAASVAAYRAALRLRPDWPQVQNDLAWVMATRAEVHPRDAAEAVRLAEAATATFNGSARMLATLAAAYAAAGRFDEATSTINEAAVWAMSDPDSAVLRQQIRQQQAAYLRGRRWRPSDSAPRPAPVVAGRPSP